MIFYEIITMISIGTGNSFHVHKFFMICLQILFLYNFKGRTANLITSRELITALSLINWKK